MRVVIDTNIIIAIIAKKFPYRWLFNGIISGKFNLCVSTEILLEYREVLTNKTNTDVAENFISFLMINSNVKQIETYYSFNLIHADSSDNKFVDCAIAANAEYVILNDRHFQILRTIDFPKINILTLLEFQDINQIT